VKFQDDKTRTFEITDIPQRVAPEKGIISHESPLGKALIGRAVGERAVYAVNDRAIIAEVIEING